MSRLKQIKIISFLSFIFLGIFITSFSIRAQEDNLLPDPDIPERILHIENKHTFEMNERTYKIDVHGTNIWASTENSIQKWNKLTGTYTEFNAKNGLSGDIVIDLELANDGTVWVATNKGIDQIIGNKITHLAFNFLSPHQITDLEFGGGGTLYILVDETIIFELNQNFIRNISPKFTVNIDEGARCFVDYRRPPKYSKIEYLPNGVLFAFGNTNWDCFINPKKQWKAPRLEGASLGLEDISFDEDGGVWIIGDLPHRSEDGSGTTSSDAIAKISDGFLLDKPSFNYQQFHKISFVYPGRNEALQIIPKKDNDIWILTNNFPAHFNGTAWQHYGSIFSSLSVKIANETQREAVENATSSTSNGIFTSMIFDSNGTPWFSGRYIANGLGKDAKIYADGLLDKISGSGLGGFLLHVDKNENSWLLFDNHLAIYDGDNYRYEFSQTGYNGEPYWGTDESLWLEGYYLRQFKNGKWTQFGPEDGVPEGLPLKAQFIDSEERTWIYAHRKTSHNTGEDFYFIFDDQQLTRFFPDEVRPNHWIEAERIFEHNTQIWVQYDAVTTKAFYVYTNGKWEEIAPPFAPEPGSGNFRVPSVDDYFLTSHDQLWVITSKGIAVSDRDRNEEHWITYEFPAGFEMRDFQSNFADQYYLDSDDSLWIIGNLGLAKFDGQEISLHKFPNRFINNEDLNYFLNKTQFIFGGSEGEIWIYGVNSNNKLAYMIFDHNVFSKPYPSSTLYSQTRGNKLYAFDNVESFIGEWAYFEVRSKNYLPNIGQ